MYESPSGLGCAKTRKRSIAIEQLIVQIAFGAHIAMAFNFEVKRKNIILVPLRTFEFSHRLGPERTLSRPAAKTGGKAEPSPPRTTSRLAKVRSKKGNHRSVEFLVKPERSKSNLSLQTSGATRANSPGHGAIKLKCPAFGTT